MHKFEYAKFICRVIWVYYLFRDKEKMLHSATGVLHQVGNKQQLLSKLAQLFNLHVFSKLLVETRNGTSAN